jgi:hypothetical protein
MHTKRLALATVSFAAALGLAAPIKTAFAQAAQSAPGARQTTARRAPASTCR